MDCRSLLQPREVAHQPRRPMHQHRVGAPTQTYMNVSSCPQHPEHVARCNPTACCWSLRDSAALHSRSSIKKVAPPKASELARWSHVRVWRRRRHAAIRRARSASRCAWTGRSSAACALDKPKVVGREQQHVRRHFGFDSERHGLAVQDLFFAQDAAFADRVRMRRVHANATRASSQT